jgi:hypothetical protein
MPACFVHETKNTTLLPPKSVSETNREKAEVAEKVAVSAQGKRSVSPRCAPSTLTDVEELIGALVASKSGSGYLPLLPHTLSSVALYYKAGTSTSHVNMFNASAVLGVTQSTTTVSEQWRRFVGRQLVLLVELMIYCIPSFFVDNAATINPLGKRKARGAVRTDLSLNKQSFVATRARVDTAAVRNWALQYARSARVIDVASGSKDVGLFVDAIELSLPLAHDEKTVLMLKEPTLTPTGSLLSFCSDVIMQVQCAYALGRLASVSSLLVPCTQTEMDRFTAVHPDTAVDEDTPCVSVGQLWSGVQLSADKAPPAVAVFVKAAAERGYTLLPYYGLYRLARCLFKPNEEISASTMNGVTSRFRTLFNGFRARHLAKTEPLYQVLDALHKPYQVNDNTFTDFAPAMKCSHFPNAHIAMLLYLSLTTLHPRLKCDTSRLRTPALALHEVLEPLKVDCLQLSRE